jgi:hypothetical protein
MGSNFKLSVFRRLVYDRVLTIQGYFLFVGMITATLLWYGGLG